MAKLNKIFVIPLMASILPLAVFALARPATAFQKVRLQKRKVVARGRLASSGERLQIVTWQTANPPSGALPYAKAHLAIETVGNPPRMVWETDGGDSQYLVDGVQVADLDKDGTPEIVSLWWVGASAGAELRVFHWNTNQKSFVEVESELDGIYRYRISPANSRQRIQVYTRSERPASSPAPSDEYELRNATLVLVNKKGEGKPVNSETQRASGIEGEAVISPIKPVTRMNDPSPKFAPYQTAFVVVTAKEGREIARFESAADGKFRVNLPPGEYIIRPAVQRRMPRASDVEVVVNAGKFSHVRIEFDSGMR